MYTITATVTYHGEDGAWETVMLPTFYLNENVQGIVSDKHAKRIAHTIVNPFHDPNIYASITAVKV